MQNKIDILVFISAQTFSLIILCGLLKLIVRGKFNWQQERIYYLNLFCSFVTSISYGITMDYFLGNSQNGFWLMHITIPLNFAITGSIFLYENHVSYYRTKIIYIVGLVIITIDSFILEDFLSFPGYGIGLESLFVLILVFQEAYLIYKDGDYKNPILWFVIGLFFWHTYELINVIAYKFFGEYSIFQFRAFVNIPRNLIISMVFLWKLKK